MHNLNVHQSALQYNPNSIYDLNIAVLIHCRDGFRQRVEWMRKIGFYNTAGVILHVTLIASRGDWAEHADLVVGWPCPDVTFLEMSSHHAIPKIHGYYVWLSQSELRARWHLRVDDDSITDISGMLSHLNMRYGDMPVHVMSSPRDEEIGDPIFAEYLSGKGIRSSLLHEYESSITSHAALVAAFRSPVAMEIIEDTGRLFEGPGDRVLAIVMSICGVPLAVNPRFTKDCDRDRLTLTGGPLHHIHYIDWGDFAFTAMLSALLHGKRVSLDETVCNSLVGRALPFGRCIGVPLAELIFRADGKLDGGTHENEQFWTYAHGRVLLLSGRGVATTAYDTLLDDGVRTWLIGPHLFQDTLHFLRLR